MSTMDDFAPYIGEGGVKWKPALPLPNVEDIDPIYFLNDLAARGHMLTPKWGYSDFQAGPQMSNWTQFFLKGDGEGYAVVYGSRGPRVVRFAICKHEKEEGAGADHRRGWHPGKCRLCGMDMSIDSGD